MQNGAQSSSVVIAEETSKLVFTDVGAKKVEYLLLGEDVLTVEVSD